LICPGPPSFYAAARGLEEDAHALAARHLAVALSCLSRILRVCGSGQETRRHCEVSWLLRKKHPLAWRPGPTGKRHQALLSPGGPRVCLGSAFVFLRVTLLF